MEQMDWAALVGRTVAGEVRRYRQMRGMSAQQLSDRCGELGMKIPRTVLSNIENGRRGNIGVAEILILGRALEVPPASLVFPVGYVEEVEALPNEKMHPLHAVRWFSGEAPLPGPGIAMAAWMKTAMFLVRKVHEGKEQVHRLQSRIMDLSSLIAETEPGPLRRAYEDAATEAARQFRAGEESVQGWIESLKEGSELHPPIDYPDSGNLQGVVNIEMASEKIESAIARVVGRISEGSSQDMETDE
ncbi:helix-turn-helix domain-containing protein [Actinacidiphila alni]|uniref:helix-turn-helix domain-containing protein n=1 Tax=Actinacidiphila alni TaxID=380248 RepID=UPI003453822B